MHKYEPQSSDFSKAQNSLHCAVKHNGEEQPLHRYLYHLSDVTVADHIISLDTPPKIVQFKSDNFSTQCKSKYIFCYLTYYGISGHGKGLVDGMRAFGVKNVLRKAIVTENLSYHNTSDIYNYLMKIFY